MNKMTQNTLIAILLAGLAMPALAARDDKATSAAIKGYFKQGQAQIRRENRDHLQANLLANQQAMLQQNSQMKLAQNRAALVGAQSANLAP
jgi:ABC-type hemin transport system ATPase subunit